jgi:hypothetical protein
MSGEKKCAYCDGDGWLDVCQTVKCTACLGSGLDSYSELSALRKELEEVGKEHQDYIRLTRGNFNTLWHRLGQVHQEFCMRPDAKELIEGIILEAREIADYCVNHGSTEKHAEFKDLKQAMETEASLRSQLEKAREVLKEIEQLVAGPKGGAGECYGVVNSIKVIFYKLAKEAAKNHQVESVLINAKEFLEGKNFANLENSKSGDAL